MSWDYLAENHCTVTYLLFIITRFNETATSEIIAPSHKLCMGWGYQAESTAPSLTVCWLCNKMFKRLSSTTSIHYHSHTINHVIQYILWLKDIQVYSHSIGNETRAFFRKQFQCHGTHSLLRMIKCNEILGSTKCNIPHSLLFMKYVMPWCSIDNSVFPLTFC